MSRLLPGPGTDSVVLPGKIRIIGGKWRSRKLEVIDTEDLRPTPDRVRETLFNWLRPCIEGAVCLDLYAGTGALGFEALSRGAAEVSMVDRNPVVVRALELQAEKLGAQGLDIICADSMEWLKNCRKKYDIVFLDPPFSKMLLGKLVDQLLNCDALHRGSLLYVETDHDFKYDDTRLHVIKTGKAGVVQFMLFEHTERQTA